MKKYVIFMFSGQGSQYYHMGQELFQNNSVFRYWMDRLDSIVYEMISESIVDHIYDKKRQKSELFNRTLHTHPAIFMVEYALAQVLLEKGIKPDYVMGTSMGEFVSVAFSGVMSIEETIDVLIKQAEYLETFCQAGGMLAIFHNYNLYNKTAVLYENSELVSVNYDTHFVVSGRNNQLDIVRRFLKERDINYMLLPVSRAFHSSLIEPAKTNCIDFLKEKTYKTPGVPFISSSRGSILKELPEGYLWEVVRKPIEFQKVVQKLEEGQEEYIYLDLGPSATLANFVKYNLTEDSKSKTYSILTPFGGELKELEKIIKYTKNS